MNEHRKFLVVGAAWLCLLAAPPARAQSGTNTNAGQSSPPPGTYAPAYPAQPGAYPPPPGTYAPAYPAQPGAYPPPAGAYPPPAGAYPPPAGAYPPGAYPPPPGGYPPGTYPPPPYYGPIPPEPVPPGKPAEPEVQYALHRFAFGVGLGLGIAGWGSDRAECSGAGCGTTTVGVRDYTHKIGGVIQAQASYQLLSFLRLGPVIAYSTTTKIKFKGVEGKADGALGSMLSFDIALEGTPKVGNGFWLLPRLQSGLSLLFPADELNSRLGDWKTACNSGAFKNCGSLDGARYGFNVGAGVGLLWAVSEPIRLRFDGLVEYYSFSLSNLEAGTANVTFKENVSGERLVAHVGMEF